MPHARASDPETSHAAARSVEQLSDKQEAVWAVLKQMTHERPEGVIDEALVTRYQSMLQPWQSESGIRTRRAELVEFGLVEMAPTTGLTMSGRAAKRWRVVNS